MTSTIEAMIQAFVAFQADSSNWIGAHYGEIIKIGILVISGVLGYGRLQATVKQQGSAIELLRDENNKMREELNEHCHQDQLHLTPRTYDALMARLASLEQSIRELAQAQRPRR